MANIEPYTSDLTDIEWELVRPILPVKGKLGRPPRYERRLMLNAIFYITRTSCSWRDLPHDFPKWRLVYYYFAKWQQQGVWEQINRALRDRVRVAHSKKKPHGCGHRQPAGTMGVRHQFWEPWGSGINS